MNIGELSWKLTPEAMYVSGRTITRGNSPRIIRSGYGKWNWLRLAVWNSPVSEWMSFEFPNEQEAYRCQSTLNNKYLKNPLKERGLDVMTRVQPVDIDYPGGKWTTFWRVYEKKNEQMG